MQNSSHDIQALCANFSKKLQALLQDYRFLKERLHHVTRERNDLIIQQRQAAQRIEDLMQHIHGGPIDNPCAALLSKEVIHDES